MYWILCDAKPGQVIDAVIDDDGEFHKVRIEIKHVSERHINYKTQYDARGTPFSKVASSYFIISCNAFYGHYDTIDVSINPKRTLSVRSHDLVPPNHGKVKGLYPYDEEKMSPLFRDSETDSELMEQMHELQEKRQTLVQDVDLQISEVQKKLKTKRRLRRKQFLQMVHVKQ